MDMRISEFAVAEAKARFSELIGRAEAGDDIVITRHGTPVVRLIPVGDADTQAIERRRRKREEFIAWRRLHGPTLGPDMTIKELIEAGRR